MDFSANVWNFIQMTDVFNKNLKMLYEKLKETEVTETGVPVTSAN
jgi:hypothetical protein